MEHSEEQGSTGGLQGWALGLFQLVFVIAVIGAAVGLSQALKGQVSDRAPAIADLRGASEVSVRVAALETLTFTPSIVANGTVQAIAEVSVTPQVSGEIKRVSAKFRAGSEVKKGDLLFEIDRADYELAVQRAEAEIASAKSDLQQLEAEAVLAIQEWEELYPGREVNDLAARVPQIEAAKARLGSAEANKRTSELSLQRTRIYAAVDARVLASSLEVGQIVSPGQAVGRLVGLESIELVVPLSLDQVGLIDPIIGRTASVTRRGTLAQEQSARVARVDASLDPRTRLSNVYLVPEDQSGLRIGDFIVASIQSDPINGALRLPATALSGQAQVWVIEEGQLASRDVLVLGEEPDRGTIIVAPFPIADGVVALPPLEAVEGQPVTARDTAQVSAVTGGVSNGAN